MDVCPSGGPSPVNNANSHNSTSNPNASSNTVTTVNSSNSIHSNGTNSTALSITPKLEHSPPEHYERQTVLMWGTATTNSNAQQQQPTNRSPTGTPTTNGLYSDAQQQHLMKLSNQIVVSPAIDDHHSNAHIKWNDGNKEIATGAGSVYQVHAHQDGSGVDANSIYATQVQSQSPHLSTHHSGHSIVSPEHTVHHSPSQNSQSGLQTATVPGATSVNHHQTVGSNGSSSGGGTGGSSGGSGCEVWSPAYSQYQYFTYHHAPQHASTQ